MVNSSLCNVFNVFVQAQEEREMFFSEGELVRYSRKVSNTRPETCKPATNRSCEEGCPITRKLNGCSRVEVRASRRLRELACAKTQEQIWLTAG